VATRKAIPALLGGVMLAVLGLAACASGSAVPAAPAASPPRQITAKPVGGTPGNGPRVIASPTPLPGGKAGSQRVALSDRTLVINSVTKRQAKKQQSVVIDLNVAVRDTGKKVIRNESGFYELIDPEGDTFSATAGNSGSFYGTIGSQASRSGLIEFQIPAAAAPGLFLLYRPDNGADTVITRLQVG
jgi:hypothetical protein